MRRPNWIRIGVLWSKHGLSIFRGFQLRQIRFGMFVKFPTSTQAQESKLKTHPESASSRHHLLTIDQCASSSSIHPITLQFEELSSDYPLVQSDIAGVYFYELKL